MLQDWHPYVIKFNIHYSKTLLLRFINISLFLKYFSESFKAGSSLSDSFLYSFLVCVFYIKSLSSIFVAVNYFTFLVDFLLVVILFVDVMYFVSPMQNFHLYFCTCFVYLIYLEGVVWGGS